MDIKEIKPNDKNKNTIEILDKIPDDYTGFNNLEVKQVPEYGKLFYNNKTGEMFVFSSENKVKYAMSKFKKQASKKSAKKSVKKSKKSLKEKKSVKKSAKKSVKKSKKSVKKSKKSAKKSKKSSRWLSFELH